MEFKRFTTTEEQGSSSNKGIPFTDNVSFARIVTFLQTKNSASSDKEELATDSDSVRSNNKGDSFSKYPSNRFFRGDYKKQEAEDNTAAYYKKSSRIVVDQDEANELIAIIRNTYFELGETTETETYFDRLVLKHKDLSYALALISEIVNTHLSDDHILEGVLHILSEQDYEDIGSLGITIGLACKSNQSPVIQDMLIACFEIWDYPSGVIVLEHIKTTESWLEEYRNKVINYLKR